MTDYFVPSGSASVEYVEKRSRFIGQIWPVSSEEEALDEIRQAKELYRDASHNVYAYIIKENNVIRHSDDGEPQGTGGMPVLEVLRKENVYDVCCVVTRYFGGILLGTGGLFRAYSHAAKISLEAAGISVMSLWTGMRIRCPYGCFEKIRTELQERNGIINGTEYAEDVRIAAVVPSLRSDDFITRIKELSSGTAEVLKGEEEYIAVKK